MILIDYRPSIGRRVRLEIPEGRDPFEVCNRAARALGFRIGERDSEHDRIMAARKESSAGAASVPRPLPFAERAQIPAVAPAGDHMAAEDQLEDRRVACAEVAGSSPAGGVKKGDDANESTGDLARKGSELCGRANAVTGTAHPKNAGVRDTSMAAHRALLASGRLAAQQRQVLEVFLRDQMRTWTRQELARETGLGINCVCGRINELLAEQLNALREVGRKTCAVTRNSVNALALA